LRERDILGNNNFIKRRALLLFLNVENLGKGTKQDGKEEFKDGKRGNQNLQSIRQKTKDRATPTSLKTG
jgi:hypothetical protein